MNAHLQALLTAFERAGEPEPTDLVSALRGLPDSGALPSPWETWTLIGLVRHRQRQLWVADIIRTRLRGAPADLARMGALGHPDGISQSGPVPGMPEWEYYFHGRGCCLTHKVEGEAIDVDFWEDSAEYFDTFFYTKYLESLRNPEPPEQRLRELHRSTRPVRIVVGDLLAVGALTPMSGGDAHPPRVSDVVLDCADAIETFCRTWANPASRLWLGALCGDWLAADDAAAGRPGIGELTTARAEKCRQIRRERLLRETGYPAADALHGLAELGAADEPLQSAFRGPPSGLVSAALDVVEQQDDPRWCPLVYDMYSRVKSAAQPPEPSIWIRSLKFLLRHGYSADEVLAALPQAGGTAIGEAVLLALEYAPQHALPLIRKGLLADIPINRTEIAAILALIGKPWSQRELLRALETSDEQEKTADARAALLESGDKEAQRAVLAWEERNPHENEAGSFLEIDGRRLGPFYTFGELSLKRCAVRIRYEMDKFHDRVMQVKGVLPPEPSGDRPWWRMWGN
ncbi:MAG TPA: hypothetical protein VH575_00905 [Gemmataceae bacterium]|jgi:hypothetical protein